MVSLKRINKVRLIRFIGLAFIICGLFICVYHYVSIKVLDRDSKNKIEKFFDNEISNIEIENNIVDNVQESTSYKRKDYDYIAVLEIPTISLKRGLVSPHSYYNDVDYNIQIINHSTMPDVVNGNLILAGHNGASYVSFFNDLYKLSINDKVYIYYKGYKYEYSLDNFYDTLKDGDIEIYRDLNKTTITLITCKKHTKDTQVVYIGYLTNKECISE